MTHACENITSPQLLLRAVINNTQVHKARAVIRSEGNRDHASFVVQPAPTPAPPVTQSPEPQALSEYHYNCKIRIAIYWISRYQCSVGWNSLTCSYIIHVSSSGVVQKQLALNSNPKTEVAARRNQLIKIQVYGHEYFTA